VLVALSFSTPNLQPFACLFFLLPIRFFSSTPPLSRNEGTEIPRPHRSLGCASAVPCGRFRASCCFSFSVSPPVKQVQRRLQPFVVKVEDIRLLATRVIARCVKFVSAFFFRFHRRRFFQSYPPFLVLHMERVICLSSSLDYEPHPGCLPFFVFSPPTPRPLPFSRLPRR